jgi:REP element-mobilizing transposase RayT
MFSISKDTPAYYITSVTNKRLPVFQKANMKDLVCNALNEARTSAGLLLFAYVIMPDHFHVLLGTARKPSECLRYVNGISSHRVIGLLKESGYDSSLEKLSHQQGRNRYRYSLWDHHPNLKSITDEEVFMQKVNYIHQNPVRAGFVQDPKTYRWSSIRCWLRCMNEDEPLLMDLDKIRWHSRKA